VVFLIVDTMKVGAGDGMGAEEEKMELAPPVVVVF
jgi:hypothetical protein